MRGACHCGGGGSGGGEGWTQNATAPDNINNMSPHILKQCAHVLAVPLATIFSASPRGSARPSLREEARLVSGHKRSARCRSKTSGRSLCSLWRGKFPRVSFQMLCVAPEFRPGRLTSDTLTLLSRGYEDNVGDRLGTVMAARGKAVSFNSVQQKGSWKSPARHANPWH